MERKKQLSDQNCTYLYGVDGWAVLLPPNHQLQ